MGWGVGEALPQVLPLGCQHQTKISVAVFGLQQFCGPLPTPALYSLRQFWQLPLLLGQGLGRNSGFALEPTSTDLAMPAEEREKWSVVDFLNNQTTGLGFLPQSSLQSLPGLSSLGEDAGKP